MADGAREFNVPVFRENRELVASEDGGLHNPSILVFNSSWGSDKSPVNVEKFNYPSRSGVQRPTNDEDIVFLTVSFYIMTYVLHYACKLCPVLHRECILVTFSFLWVSSLLVS